jgi:hypothetical protein
MTRQTISPFPGMNPYLESVRHWSDFHATFIGTLREALNESLPPAYYAKITELVMMVEPVIDDRQGREPDVLIGHGSGRGPGVQSSATVLLEPEKLTNIATFDPHTELQIQILRMPEMELVTVVELFSPTNKQGEGRGIYLQKRKELLNTSANIVELDLIRRGKRLSLNKALPRDDYYCFISRGSSRPSCDVFHWSLRDPMPTLPIPLKTPDNDILISLAEPFRRAFARGIYGTFIDYTVAPPPPDLSAQDLEWMEVVLRTPAKEN